MLYVIVCDVFYYIVLSCLAFGFRGPLEGTSTHRIDVHHSVRNVDITYMPVILCHDLRIHGLFALTTKIPLFLVSK